MQIVIEVRSADGPLAAVLPLQLDITDPQGRPAEFSGAYAAIDGRLTVQLDLAPNDLPGLWTVRATEGASGLTAEATVNVP